MAPYSQKNWSVYAWIASILVVIVSGGGTHEYGQLFLLVLTGFWLIVTPVERLPGFALVGSLAALLLWMLVSAWMPMPFPNAVDWVATENPSFAKASGISAQPWLSTEKAAFFAVGLCWFFMLIQRPMSHYRRVGVLKWVTWAITLLAVVTILGSVLGFQHPFSWGTHRFSFFPNHNQSGAVFAMGGMLALGLVIRSMKRREWEMFLFLIPIAAISVALIMGMSRSAVMTMAAGCGIYLLLTLERRNSKFYLKLGLPVLLVFVATFMLYGGKLLDEFVSVLRSGGVGSEIRVHIWLDAARMAATFPVFGVGLGNFRYFFPFFMEHTFTSQAIHHPESDLLWVCTELGLVGFILVLIAIVLMIRRLDPVDIYRSKGIRLIGFVAISMFLFASLIEVSGHRLGTVLLALLIYALIQPGDASLHALPGVKHLSRAIGVLWLILAGVWGFSLYQNRPFVSSEIFRYVQHDPNVLFDADPPEVWSQRLDQWIERYPMVPALHNAKAVTALAVGDVERAIEGFDRSHQLNPVWWRPYMNHGLYLQDFDFDTSLRYFMGGMQVARSSGIEAFEFVAPRVRPERFPELRDLTYGSRNLQFLYFARLRNMPIEYSRELGLELAINPELDGFSSEQKQSLLWRFCEINGPEMLRRLMDRYPVLGKENWTVRAQLKAGEGDFREASRLALMNYPEPDMIDLTKARTLAAIRTEYLQDSNDPLKVIALVQKHKIDGNYAEALISLEVARQKGFKLPYLRYQTALVLFHLEKYEEAWTHFERMIWEQLRWSLE